MSGPSGAHANPRRKISDTTAAFERQDEAAAELGISWAVWARRVLHRVAQHAMVKRAQARGRKQRRGDA